MGWGELEWVGEIGVGHGEWGGLGELGKLRCVRGLG